MYIISQKREGIVFTLKRNISKIYLTKEEASVIINNIKDIKGRCDNMKNSKKVIATVVMLTSLIATTTFAQTNETTKVETPVVTTSASTPVFSDVTRFKEEIEFLTKRGVIFGYSGGTFRPTESLKRIHAVQMILREKGITNFDAPNPEFTDIKPGDAGYKEVAKAVQLGFISGKVAPNGTSYFDANGTLTRGQMAKILTDAYGLTDDNGVVFKDVSSEHWAKEYVSRLATSGVTEGYVDGTFKPGVDLQRQHFSAFMARLLQLDEVAPTPIPTPTPTPTPPAPTPAPVSKWMPQDNADVILTKTKTMTKYTFEGLSGYDLFVNGEIAVSVGFENDTDAKASMAVITDTYKTTAKTKMDVAIQAYSDTQLGAGTTQSKQMSTDFKSFLSTGKYGEKVQKTYGNKTFTFSNLFRVTRLEAVK